jgi:peptidoglycan/LPS O-acetylase OafA/YrhL
MPKSMQVAQSRGLNRKQTPEYWLRVPALLVQITAGVIFIQLILGGAYLVGVAGYPSIPGMDSVHPVFGLVVGILALAALIGCFLAKPGDRSLRYSVTATFVLVVLVGFTADKSSMLPHDTLATVAFGLSIVSAILALKWNAMPIPAKQTS